MSDDATELRISIGRMLQEWQDALLSHETAALEASTAISRYVLAGEADIIRSCIDDVKRALSRGPSGRKFLPPNQPPREAELPQRALLLPALDGPTAEVS